MATLNKDHQLSLNAGQKYCIMHSAIFWTFIKLQFVIKIIVLSFFECFYCRSLRIRMPSMSAYTDIAQGIF